MLTFDTFAYFLDLLTAAVLFAPLFWLIPNMAIRKLLLAILGTILLWSIAPRLLFFYLIFWVVVWVMHQVVERTAEHRSGISTLSISVVTLLAALVVWRLAETTFIVRFNLDLNTALGILPTRVTDVDLSRNIITPIGLSFAIFRAIDFLVQSNLGVVERRSLGDVMYVGLFPPIQVIGPVAEYNETQPTTDRWPSADRATEAFLFIVSGLVKVFLLAHPLRQSVDVFAFFESNTPLAIWTELFLYAWFFYLNFAGYSDIAIGCARLFGVDLKKNFDWPYFTTGPQDFWNRWHMSLTRFAQRNVFVPLGGMRANRQYVAVFATIMVIALWHNISYGLLIFGLYHAAGLIGQRLLASRRPPSSSSVVRLLKMPVLFTYVMLSLPLLALELDPAMDFYRAMIGVA